MTFVSGSVEAAHCCGERRLDPRVRVPLSLRVSVDRDGRMVSEKTRIVNVSAGGAYFGSDAGLRVGDEVLVSIAVPPTVYMADPPAEFSGPATVIRINRESPPPGKVAGVAVRFNARLAFRSPGAGQLFSAAPSG